MTVYDLLILGGGPAGLAAGIYGGRAKFKTAVIEKGVLGGTVYTTREIVNYPGSFKEVSGPDLMKEWTEHAKYFGTEFIKGEVAEVEVEGEIKIVKTKKGDEYRAKAIILATGSEPRMLNVPGERKFRGDGVSYCATCDADFYSGLEIVVVGNGDAAIEEAMYLTRFVSKVTVIVIHDVGIVDCNKNSAERAFANPKIEFVWNSVVNEIKGADGVDAVVVKNLKTGLLTEVSASGIFIYVGMIPRTQFLQGKIKMDSRGYILANEKMETSIDGVFVAGDVRDKYLRQVVTAASDGATAVVAAERYLLEEEAFKEQIVAAKAPVLLAFWNPTDAKSIHALANLEKSAEELSDKMKLVKVDVYKNQRLAKRYAVKNTPAVLLLKEGKVWADFTGFIQEDALTEKIAELIGQNI